MNKGFSHLLIAAVLMTPPVETFLNQYLPYEISRALGVKNIVLLSVFSGIFFGVLHLGNLSTVLLTGGVGFFLQLWYELAREAKQPQFPREISGNPIAAICVDVFL